MVPRQQQAAIDHPGRESGAVPYSILIESVSPEIDGGRFPVKREVGDIMTVSADIFKDGHDTFIATLLYRQRSQPHWQSTPMVHLENDRWTGSFPLDHIGRYEYTIEAAPDRFATWQEELAKKYDAGADISLEMLEGQHLLQEIIQQAPLPVVHPLQQIIDLIAAGESLETAVPRMLSPTINEIVNSLRSQEDSTRYVRELEVIVDRVKARYGTWYELFPRSAGTRHRESGTFDDVIDRLPHIAAAGFDVLYFPPIHPIGTTNRKGANNTLRAEPGDPGSPYAIGSEQGGHDAIEPSLGTLVDFHRLVEAASMHNIELALDLAIQTSPDHPWAKEHPEWFFVRPDGSIKCAENPPKRYEDIYPLNFQSTNWWHLWLEIRRIVLYWIDQGVTIFRVDNPHTKPTSFWEWLIANVQTIHPEVIFLSEAFTRPKVMRSLAKAGFTQSYTYFTWRNHKDEIETYFTELTNPPVSDYMRGNLFTNTPDILPFSLQHASPAAFRIRLVLAATLSSVYGIYSGFELCENLPVDGKEEYVDSEKYQFKVWDWDRPGNITADVTNMNQIRRNHHALQEYDNLQFFQTNNDQILCYGKQSPDGSDAILVVVNLDPRQIQEARIQFETSAFPAISVGPFSATDLLTGNVWIWHNGDQYIRLDPDIQAAHVFSLTPIPVAETVSD